MIQDEHGNFIRRVQVNEHGEPVEMHEGGTMVDEHGNHYTHAEAPHGQQHMEPHHQQQQHHQDQQHMGQGSTKLEKIEPDDPYAFDDNDMNGKSLGHFFQAVILFIFCRKRW